MALFDWKNEQFLNSVNPKKKMSLYLRAWSERDMKGNTDDKMRGKNKRSQRVRFQNQTWITG